MKIDIVAESVEENMSLLKQLTSIILKHLPENIEPETEFWIYGYDMVNDLKPLLTQYKDKKFKEIIIRVASTEIFVSNYVDNSFKSYGSYNHIKNNININLAGIVSNAIKWNANLVTKSLKLKSTILHELRHLAQYADYPDYYEKNLRVDLTNVKSNDEVKQRMSQAYKTRKIEIDAAWHHILDETNPVNYKTPSKYVKRVMDTLTNYKTLTSDQLKHYKIKTSRYYYLINRKENLDDIKHYVDELFKEKEYANLKEFVKEALIFYFGSDFDYDNSSPKEQKQFNDIKNIAISVFKSANL